MIITTEAVIQLTGKGFMMKKIVLMLLALLLVTTFASCKKSPTAITSSGEGEGSSGGEGKVIEPVNNPVKDPLVNDSELTSVYFRDNSTGVHEGSISDTLSTYWFKFSIDSIESVSTYGGYDATAGYKFVVVNVRVENTSSGSLPMYIDDFYLYDYNRDVDYIAYEAWTPVMMAEQVDIPEGETEVLILVYQVEDYVTDIELNFIEIFDQTLGEFYGIRTTID